MMRPLIVKEFKDLIRDPRIWIPFIISALIMPIMGLVIAVPMRSAMQQFFAKTSIGVVNLDRGEEAAKLVNFLTKRGVAVLNFTSSFEGLSKDEIISKVVKLAKRGSLNVSAVLVIPQDFSEKVKGKTRAPITLFTVVEEVSFFGSPKVYKIKGVLEEYLRSELLKGTKLKPEVVMEPAELTTMTYLKGKDKLFRGDPGTILSSLGFSSFFLPLILMIISVSVIQMAATSMAVENEERTLETLLTFPLSKFNILLSKLLGSFSVALIGSLLSLGGFLGYIYIFSTTIPKEGGMGGFGISTLLISGVDLLYLFISVLATLFFMAALGVVVGALSSDVRIAGSITGPLSMAIFIPGYFVAFASLKGLNLALKVLLYSLPLTQPIVFAKEAITSNLPPQAPIYLVGSLILSLVVVALTAKIFSLETLSNLQRRLSRLRRRRG